MAKQKPIRTYSIEQVSVLTGLPMRTWRKVAGQGSFPAFTSGMINGFPGPVFNADEIDAWRADRAIKMAEYPCRYEAGPYPSKERAEATCRRMNRYSVGAVAVTNKAGDHLAIVPVPDGVTPDEIAENLAELFPAVQFRLFDVVGYVDDIEPVTR